MLVKSKTNTEHLEDLRETFDTLQKYKMKLNPTKCAFGVSSILEITSSIALTNQFQRKWRNYTSSL